MIGANICRANFKNSYLKNLNLDSTIMVLHGHTESVSSVAFSPCEKYIISGSCNINKYVYKHKILYKCIYINIYQDTFEIYI